MEVGFGELGEVEVDDYVDTHDVNTSREQVSTHKNSSLSSLEVVIDAVSVVLSHLRVDVEAVEAKVSDLLGQQLHSLGGIAEDDGLVDLQLRKQGVQTVKFLSLLKEGIVPKETRN